jgi:hypothetical protein
MVAITTIITFASIGLISEWVAWRYENSGVGPSVLESMLRSGAFVHSQVLCV